jgi:hypothetical protein
MGRRNAEQNRGTRNPSLVFSNRDRLGPYRRFLPYALIGAVVLLAAGIWLGTQLAAPKPAATPTKELPTIRPSGISCAPDRVRPDVEKVDALMVEFYDASAIASQTPADKLPDYIPGLQEIRRRALALKVSACLKALQSYQISHMNMVINTLMAFMAKSDQSVLTEGVIQARLLNEEYKKEKARLLGETYVPPATRAPSATAAAGTPGTPGTPPDTPTATP